MNLSQAILRDLKDGQSSASATARRLRIDPAHAETLLQRHVTDGAVEIRSIYISSTPALKTYRLTQTTNQTP